MTAQQLTDQENEIKALWESGALPWLTHLAGGNEQWLVDFFRENIKPTDWVLASHRCHFHYTLHGGTDLIEKVKEGRSMFLYSERFICSAIVAGVCSIACGIALGIQQKGTEERVWVFVGDGATDEGSFWEALRFAKHRDLPLTFIIEDNGGQCGVKWHERWAGKSVDGWPLSWETELIGHKKVIYYNFEPTYPHAGTLGPDGKPTRPPIRYDRTNQKVH
jgi:TPP-dependent pyruvate/acetoin dehydrogenase alpha subunit